MMFRVLVTLNEELLRFNESQSQIFRILFADQLINTQSSRINHHLISWQSGQK